MHDELEVRLYARRVGTLTRSARNRLTFRYDETYVDQQGAAPLSTSMPVRSNPYGPEITEPWFNGLLAEGRRREHLARIAGAAGIDTWSLLHAAGGECAGAVQIVAAEHRDAPGLFHLDEERLATLLRETPIEPLASVSPAARISIAGAQEKVTLYRNEDGSWAVPTGGHPSTHILKPQAADFPSLVENEHWCMENRTTGRTGDGKHVDRNHRRAAGVGHRTLRPATRPAMRHQTGAPRGHGTGARAAVEIPERRRPRHIRSVHGARAKPRRAVRISSCSAGSSEIATRTRRTTRSSSPGRPTRGSHRSTTCCRRSATRGSINDSRPRSGAQRI